MASGKHTGSYELKSAKIIRGGEAVDRHKVVQG